MNFVHHTQNMRTTLITITISLLLFFVAGLSAQVPETVQDSGRIFDVSVGWDTYSEALLNFEYDRASGKRFVNPYFGVEVGKIDWCRHNLDTLFSMDAMIPDTMIVFPCVEELSYDYADVIVGFSFYRKSKGKSLEDNGFNLRTGIRYRIRSLRKSFSAGLVLDAGYKFFLTEKLYVFGSLNTEFGASYAKYSTTGVAIANKGWNPWLLPDGSMSLRVRVGYLF